MPELSLLNAVEEAQLLSIFKNICVAYDDYNERNKLRNILYIFLNSSSFPFIKSCLF